MGRSSVACSADNFVFFALGIHKLVERWDKCLKSPDSRPWTFYRVLCELSAIVYFVVLLLTTLVVHVVQLFSKLCVCASGWYLSNEMTSNL